jgi:hypothetical protein
MTTSMNNLAFGQRNEWIFPWTGTTMFIGTMSKVNGKIIWIDVTAFTTTMDDWVSAVGRYDINWLGAKHVKWKGKYTMGISGIWITQHGVLGIQHMINWNGQRGTTRIGLIGWNWNWTTIWMDGTVTRRRFWNGYEDNWYVYLEMWVRCGLRHETEYDF